jgi:hypothetical protein
MTTEGILSGTLFLGLLAAFWSKLKLLVWRVTNLAIVRITVDGTASEPVSQYLWKNGKRSWLGEKAYKGDNLFVRPADRRLMVGFETVGRDPATFWFGWRPISVRYGAESVTQTHAEWRLTLSFIRGMFDADRLITRAIDEHNERVHSGDKRFNVTRVMGYWNQAQTFSGNGAAPGNAPVSNDCRTAEVGGIRYLRWVQEDIGPPDPDDPLGPLALPPEVTALVTQAERWKASEKWYKERRIPWRLGFAFFGKPGTGKTVLSKAMAQTLDLPVFVMELATFNDRDLIEAWHKAVAQTPCMIVIEDIDAVFNMRTNLIPDSKLSFSCLLNCIDGIESGDGVIFVITSNHADKVDPALGIPDSTGMSTRPGRVDQAVEILPLDAVRRRQVAQRVLCDCADEIEETVIRGHGDTAAQFQARCRNIALARHWNRKVDHDHAGIQEDDPRPIPYPQVPPGGYDRHWANVDPPGGAGQGGGEAQWAHDRGPEMSALPGCGASSKGAS